MNWIKCLGAPYLTDQQDTKAFDYFKHQYFHTKNSRMNSQAHSVVRYLVVLEKNIYCQVKLCQGLVGNQL